MYEESPRWLIAKGRNEEALKILANFHADGNLLDEEVQKEYIEIKESIRREQEVSKQTYLQLFATPGNRRRIFICIFAGLSAAWSGNGLVTHYLYAVLNTVGITSTYSQLLINGMLQIWNLIWASCAALLVDRVGRKPLWRASTIGMLTFFVTQTICTAVYSIHGSVAAGYASIINIFLFFASYDIAMTPLVIAYPVEILTFTIRAKGMGLYGMVNGLAVFITIYVNPIAFAAIGWKLYIVYCGWLALEVIIVWNVFIETKGRTLEELAVLFDGDQAPLVIEKIRQIEELARADVQNGEKNEDV
jgi:MFS family permease